MIDAAAERAMARGRVSVIMVETPSNPLNTLVDLSLIAALRERIAAAQGHAPVVICGNTMLGPILQAPLRHGVDVVVYSLTKHTGGRSDLIGAAGLDPHSCWMAGRSLETLSPRMHAAARNAEAMASFLALHPRMRHVHAFNLLREGDPAASVQARQATGAGSTFGPARPSARLDLRPGSTFSIVIEGGITEAFRVLNALRIFKLAVSLGGTESPVNHPASTAHSGVPAAVRAQAGVDDGLVMERPSSQVMLIKA